MLNPTLLTLHQNINVLHILVASVKCRSLSRIDLRNFLLTCVVWRLHVCLWIIHVPKIESTPESGETKKPFSHRLHVQARFFMGLHVQVDVRAKSRRYLYFDWNQIWYFQALHILWLCSLHVPCVCTWRHIIMYHPTWIMPPWIVSSSLVRTG